MDGLWIVREVCRCPDKKRENRIQHAGFPELVFCVHDRKKQLNDHTVQPSHDEVALCDSKFDYLLSVDTTAWGKLGCSKQKLYYFVICSKVSNGGKRKLLFKDYLQHNVMFFFLLKNKIVWFHFFFLFVCFRILKIMTRLPTISKNRNPETRPWSKDCKENVIVYCLVCHCVIQGHLNHKI